MKIIIEETLVKDGAIRVFGNSDLEKIIIEAEYLDDASSRAHLPRDEARRLASGLANWATRRLPEAQFFATYSEEGEITSSVELIRSPIHEFLLFQVFDGGFVVQLMIESPHAKRLHHLITSWADTELYESHPHP